MAGGAGLSLQAGARVRVHGHKALSHLNGKEGTCLRCDDASGKWEVCLSNGETRKLKPENLLVLHIEAPGTNGHNTMDAVGSVAHVSAASDAQVVAPSSTSSVSAVQNQAPASRPGRFSALADKGVAPAVSSGRGPATAAAAPTVTADGYLSMLDRLAREQTAKEQRLLDKNRAAVQEASSVPALAELLEQLDGEDQEVFEEQAPAPSSKGDGPRGHAAAPDLGALLARLDWEEADQAASSSEQAVPSLDLVLASIEEDEATDVSRQIFFRLGSGDFAEPEGPQDTLSKIIRLTSSGIDPGSLIARPSDAAPEGSALQPELQFRFRKANWSAQEDKPKQPKGTARAGLLTEAPLLGRGRPGKSPEP